MRELASGSLVINLNEPEGFENVAYVWGAQ